MQVPDLPGLITSVITGLMFWSGVCPEKYILNSLPFTDLIQGGKTINLLYFNVANIKRYTVFCLEIKVLLTYLRGI